MKSLIILSLIGVLLSAPTGISTISDCNTCLNSGNRACGDFSDPSKRFLATACCSSGDIHTSCIAKNNVFCANGTNDLSYRYCKQAKACGTNFQYLQNKEVKFGGEINETECIFQIGLQQYEADASEEEKYIARFFGREGSSFDFFSDIYLYLSSNKSYVKQSVLYEKDHFDVLLDPKHEPGQ